MNLALRLASGTFAVVVVVVVFLLWGTHTEVTGFVVLCLVVAAVMAWLAGRVLARPMVTLSESAREIAAGALPQIPRSGVDEVDAVAEAIRRMTRDLGARAADLHRERTGGSALVDAMVEGVIACDARGHVVSVNPAARRLLGYGPHAFLPPVQTLFRTRNAQEAVAAVLGGAEVHDCIVEMDDCVLALNARPLAEQRAVLVIHDLTEMRRLEAVRRDFVANVSHELKTPLTSIVGYADTLADPSIDDATRAHFISTILANAKRMQRLVDDLLDLSRIESGRWTPERSDIDIAPIAAEVWENFHARASSRETRLELKIARDATQLHADPDALRQILTNLVDNALRYVPQGGSVAVQTEAVDDGVAMKVRDDGAGIAREHVSRIFERFYRVDPSRSRDEGGTGLGLAIVRHLVEAHGGSVSVESELHHGTTVRCWFPGATERETTG